MPKKSKTVTMQDLGEAIGARKPHVRTYVMAQLPPDGEWLVQSTEGMTFIVNRYTEEEIVSFPARDANLTAQAMGVIHESDKLTDEQKCFAYFWCGYFYAHS